MLNDDQRCVYETVMFTISHQSKHEEKLCNCEKESLPIRLYVSGQAGTGKSTLIHALVTKLNEQYKRVQKTARDQSEAAILTDAEQRCVVVCIAPTGIAAYNINGLTIHRLFSISVQTSKNWAQRDLSSDRVKILRKALEHVKLFIIDEISMVSNVLLAKIDARMNQLWNVVHSNAAKAHDRYFGGKNVIIFRA